MEDELEHAVDDERGWIHFAACADCKNPDDWFPDQAPYTSEEKAVIERAVNTCFNDCPVRLECLQQACDLKVQDGIWGGLTGTKRKSKRYRFIELAVIPNPYE